MNTTKMPVSPITIGTVQFGLPYGLKENAKASSQEDVNQALNSMLLRGITSIDTAAAYGNSEEKIGIWMKSVQPKQSITIATKINNLDATSEKTVIQSMRKQLLFSGQRLKLSCVPVVMIHHFDEYMAHQKWIDKAFSLMKEEGLIHFCGLSAYSTDDYRRIAEAKLDAIQIPVNLLDWKQIDSGGLRALKDAGILIYARSVFLQGLLLRSPEELSPHMQFAAETLEKYVNLCRQFSLSQKEVALAFVRSLPEIDSVVIGCRSAEQVENSIDTFMRQKRLSTEQLSIIHDLFSQTNTRIILPSLW